MLQRVKLEKCVRCVRRVCKTDRIETMSERYIHFPPKHNYQKRIEELTEEGLMKDVVFINVGHDKHCRVFGGGYCNCDPELFIVRSGADPKDLPPSIIKAMKKEGLL